MGSAPSHFLPGRQLVASASNDRMARLWDVATGLACGTLEGHSSVVRAVAYNRTSSWWRQPPKTAWPGSRTRPRQRGATIKDYWDWVGAVIPKKGLALGVSVKLSTRRY